MQPRRLHMPRESPYGIVLTEEERGELTKRAKKYTLPYFSVSRAKLFGRCERRTGIASFDRLVDDVMCQPPYATARRVFWIVDSGSSHRGPRSVERLQLDDRVFENERRTTKGNKA